MSPLEIDIRPLIIGESTAIRTLREYLPKVAARDCTVLITGETGTGKERIAEAIHYSSPRRNSEMVCINCAALPEGLLESELYGHEKGAFTSAHTRYLGKMKMADGGTLLLDEIGDMSLQCQAKILRALETREISPLGGGGRVPVDIRIIAATNQELLPLIEQNRFRKDLFYRLNVAHLVLPPLRHRKEDIPLLFQHYLNHFNQRFDEHVHGATPDALAALMRYDWPGNIRELRNLIESLFIDPGSTISCDQLPERIQQLGKLTGTAEKERLVAALCATNWNKSRAAQELNWSRMTLYRKLKKHQLSTSAFAPQSAKLSATRAATSKRHS